MRRGLEDAVNDEPKDLTVDKKLPLASERESCLDAQLVSQ